MAHTHVSELVTYPAPEGAAGSSDFAVRVRVEGGERQPLFVYRVRVDMHDVREASMATFDFEGAVMIEVTYRRGELREAAIRPLSRQVAYEVHGDKIVFLLDRPAKISIEANGDRFHNLHLFAAGLETKHPDLGSPKTLVIEPGSYSASEWISSIEEGDRGGSPSDVIYFAPGMHRFEDGLFHVPSGKTVYLAGGAIVVGSFVCHRVENVAIRGRGIIYLRDIEKTTYWRSVQIDYSREVTVEDIISIDPPHYSIHLGQSTHVRIRNFKSFSARGWCDGIDMMSCSDVTIEDVFLRTSDDCIAVYGSRGAFRGGSSNVRVSGAILWADVAHPIMIGVHGDHEGDGDIIEAITFNDIDILEHHEPQDGYWGCMAINAGDNNMVRGVAFNDIRIEPFELGRLFDIRVFHNPKYNPHPGKRVENVRFDNISFDGICDNPSVIAGYDEQRLVEGVHFRNLRINGRLIESTQAGNFEFNAFVSNVTFEA